MEVTNTNVITFFVNGQEIILENPDPEISLLHFLRNSLRLTGSKLGCGEGGCGACTVMLSQYDARTDTIRTTQLVGNVGFTPPAGLQAHQQGCTNNGYDFIMKV